MGQGNLHVLIIGAGNSGVVLAQGLKKHGISFSIFESEEKQSVYRRQWGMSLQWGLAMLRDVLPEDIFDRLQAEAAVDPHYFFREAGNSMPIWNVATGELLKDVPLVKMLRVSRQHMRNLCSEGLNIEYGKVLERVELDSNDSDLVNAIFADGTVASGSLIIGADGANSAVRKAAFYGKEASTAKVSEYTGVNFHTCYHDAELARNLRQILSPIMTIGIDPRGYWLWLSVQDVPDPNKPEDWSFQLQWTYKMNRDPQLTTNIDLATLKEYAEGFAEPWKSAWKSVSADTRLSAMRISSWMPQPLPNDAWQGHVALVGDAAHAMSFHRGQGMNHGIADAVKMTQVLVAVQKGEMTQKDAILEYEAEMIKRAGEEVGISKMNTEMIHDWEKFRQSAFMQRGGDMNK